MLETQPDLRAIHVSRFRIMLHEEHSVEINCQLLDAGIDPENLWTLVMSSDNEHAAKTRLEVERLRNRVPTSRYRFVDGGQSEMIKH